MTSRDSKGLFSLLKEICNDISGTMPPHYLCMFPSNETILSSAFLAQPITIDCIYSRTGPRETGASATNPIKQARQVHLKCGSRILCIATSSVTVTSPECERLLLDEKFALGQIFRQLRVYPEFSLLDVGAQVVDGKRELQRTYLLETEGIMCQILEVFPDRDLFDIGAAWLHQGTQRKSSERATN
ncbi:hypothetical protein GSI_13478 [Ganoderma sinense ZZ0214-1]|uniref:Uncharacterized protein n=1 Tax=Ganoderma sinense ZZ0214-1 TaxID=1077348 RepID=A0A2G8RQW6_9APHY|nr:hypothetical protein GSI_13478 [Ganoderma sinense ZZ0214-1]